jgi:peptide methionine sulfoxide reductase MsrA
VVGEEREHGEPDPGDYKINQAAYNTFKKQKKTKKLFNLSVIQYLKNYFKAPREHQTFRRKNRKFRVKITVRAFLFVNILKMLWINSLPCA